jgi:hypothetical protein
MTHVGRGRVLWWGGRRTFRSRSRFIVTRGGLVVVSSPKGGCQAAGPGLASTSPRLDGCVAHRRVHDLARSTYWNSTTDGPLIDPPADPWDESFVGCFHPVDALLEPGANLQLNQSAHGVATYRLIPDLRLAAKTKKPAEILALAAEAFFFAAQGAETVLDERAATARGNAFADLAVTGWMAYEVFRGGVDVPTLKADTVKLLKKQDPVPGLHRRTGRRHGGHGSRLGLRRRVGAAGSARRAGRAARGRRTGQPSKWNCPLHTASSPSIPDAVLDTCASYRVTGGIP